MKSLTIVPGSLADAAAKSGGSLAESFVDAEIIDIVDCSGSMACCDSRDNRSRYNVACQELAALQARRPGKHAIISFSSYPQFRPGGHLPDPSGGTDLAGALKFARLADLDGMQFFVISDGRPDNEHDALAEAKKYKARISCIYVGPEGGNGQRFLEQLANASGGQFATAEKAIELAATVELLLEAANKKEGR